MWSARRSAVTSSSTSTSCSTSTSSSTSASDLPPPAAHSLPNIKVAACRSATLTSYTLRRGGPIFTEQWPDTHTRTHARTNPSARTHTHARTILRARTHELTHTHTRTRTRTHIHKIQIRVQFRIWGVLHSNDLLATTLV